MKHFIKFLFFLLTGINSLCAQTTVSGSVSDNKGNAIPGANVFIKDTYDGATSDADGKFSFTTTESGEHMITVSFIGFETWEQELILDSSEKRMNIKMKEAVNELKTVIIAAGAFEASDEKKMVILRALDIVTTAGASGADLAARPESVVSGNRRRVDADAW